MNIKDRRNRRNFDHHDYNNHSLNNHHNSTLMHSQQLQGLTAKQKKKAQEKFDSLKAMGSLMISKKQLRHATQQMGFKLTQQQLLQMLHQGDIKGQGYITYPSFQNIIQKYKQAHQTQVQSVLGLTYDQILRKQNQDQETPHASYITYSYMQKFLQEQFQLQLNFKSIYRSFNGQNQSKISRQQFKKLFS